MAASRLARSRRSQAYGARATRVLEEGATCWRIRNASRATPLIDGAAYFDALRQALETARERVFIIGWDIRSDISLDPQGHQPPLAHYLRALVQRHRGLRIYILIWDWLLFFSLDRQLFPQYRFERFFGSRVRLVMDGNHPPGGCHHEKLVVVDDALAFCGGIDLAKGRWDRPQHHVNEPARGAYGDASLPPFHDLMLMVEGEVAASLDELARERWRRATGVRLGPPRRQARPPPWPQETPAWFENVPVGIARTRPKWGRQTAVREIGALLHAAIGAARRTIYIESQYFTVESIGQAIADKLALDDGPEVVIIGPERCEGFVETAVMDVGRSRVLNRIRAADRHQRARIVTATVEENGRRAAINVHAKLLIVDDRLLIVGSANLANRSIGVDTECNLAIEADGRCAEQGIARTRTALLAEHLGVSEETLEREVEKRRSLVQAIDALNGGPRRLERLEVRTAALPEEIKESAALADPGEPITPQLIEERLAPPSRRRRLARISARFGLTVAGLGALALLLRSGMLGEGGSVELLESVEAYRSSPLGLAAATGVFIAASAAFVPVNLMIAATAAAFGPVAGLVCALAGALGAAGLLFAIGRGLGRDLVRRLAGRRMNAIDRRLAEQGVMAVVMLRLMPIAPFAAVNLIAGSTAVRARDFLLGTLIGMAPGIIVMTIFGDRLGAWLKRPDAENFWILAASVVAALGLIWAIRQWSRRRSAAEPAHAGGNL